MRNWRTRRKRLAPSAARTRRLALAGRPAGKHEVATFAQATARTRATATAIRARTVQVLAPGDGAADGRDLGAPAGVRRRDARAPAARPGSGSRPPPAPRSTPGLRRPVRPQDPASQVVGIGDRGRAPSRRRSRSGPDLDARGQHADDHVRRAVEGQRAPTIAGSAPNSRDQNPWLEQGHAAAHPADRRRPE